MKSKVITLIREQPYSLGINIEVFRRKRLLSLEFTYKWFRKKYMPTYMYIHIE
jgi:hypothetical protein